MPSTETSTDDQRVEELLATMTLEEKLAQLVGLWEGRGDADSDGEGGDVAPMQDAMQVAVDSLEGFAGQGLGQLTRVFGTTPVEPAAQARALVAKQRWLQENTRLGIPALVHEECLTGLAAWRATTFPAPLSWGASFHPELVEEVGAAIGASMRSLGVHQGLAPVLDVVRDARWGRVEECVSEDPYVVGTITSAYVRGVQSTGVIATLKHFVGYSNSRAGRNLAPVHAGPRELADVLLPPFEMAVLDAGARSVMNSYTEVDGIPVAADERLLTDLLRERWGFAGTVVADYFSVAFLERLHAVAASSGDAAAQALTAGIDVELPTGVTYLEPLAARVRAGEVEEALVDRALRRVLRQKAELGLLAPDYDPAAGIDPDRIDLDPPQHRALARTLAEESIVLLSNDGTLPLADLAGRAEPARVCVVGPNADDPSALFGCYSFANHVLAQHPDVELGLDVDSVLAALGTEFGAGARISHVRGADVDTDDTSGFEAAVAAAAQAEVCVAVVGDRAGLFGRGTSGEGCDAESLELPGVQRPFVEALLATGTPVVLVLLTGRPYAVDWALERCAAVVQAFFPGQEGAGAIAGVLSGRVNPSGRLPVSLPRSVGAQPYSYLHPKLGAASPVSNIDTAPVRPFGHGLSYTTFAHADLRLAATEVPTDGSLVATVRVTNTGDRAGAHVVQLYGSDPVASVTRPVVQLLGYARVQLDAGASADVTLDVPTQRLAFSDRRMVRVVEPGRIDLFVGHDCATPDLSASVELTGGVHEVTAADRRLVRVDVAPA
ncbi:glycoside hydrolase family 3 N-terminal domain-containing protein [Kineococcus radiotolerans]|uniref:Glycoside hydrolase family 3 domain protein n=1 Tax=Kineococcus radiotolerans (strain ATCC BAA-149 / DSM 14245 / SRS30216) TaxID=266940 RepID=A6WDQ4_KINRD|nr:glycoside hydrolase family 3 N-terminal domain-containing protein [Kineococcus radiotolerans]ABS04943.1 glycoside hydrolase family 3 domain protein [Kineococcus radiotolerans SRS30216 = ATCC BAA-149]